nr:response regulator transcription factor [Ancylobacter koreensis]
MVEDDPDLRDGLSEYLRLRGLEVTAVGTGLAFLQAWRAGAFDVVVLDVNLPDTTGYALARTLSGQRNEIGIVMLTARSEREDRVRGYEEGADIYLAKPADSEELVLAIRNLARRVAAARKRAAHDAASVPAMETRSWLLDLTRQRLVTPGGAGMHLTGREQVLVKAIALAAGEPVSRQHLARLLGHADRDVASRAVDAILFRLRRKAAEHGVELPLSGLHSVGLRFTGPVVVHPAEARAGTGPAGSLPPQ